DRFRVRPRSARQLNRSSKQIHLMKTIPFLSIRNAALAALVLALSGASYAESTAKADPAKKQLDTAGVIVLTSAGQHVEKGTFQIQVSTFLGRPNAVLNNGTWLYANRTIEDSDAQGTLVVRFTQGRVSELALVTTAVVTALRTDPRASL